MKMTKEIHLLNIGKAPEQEKELRSRVMGAIYNEILKVAKNYLPNDEMANHFAYGCCLGVDMVIPWGQHHLNMLKAFSSIK